jgi:hypothetical protein
MTHRTVLFSALVMLLTSCGKEGLHPTQNRARGWALNVSTDQFQLNDSDKQTADQLREQVVRANAHLQTFHDPSSRSPADGRASPWDIRLSVLGSKEGSVDFTWLQPSRAQATFGFAQCSSRTVPLKQGVPCESLALLSCLSTQSVATRDGSSAFSTSALNRSLLLNWLKDCGASLALASRKNQTVSFSIENDRVIFSPQIVFSILLFEGLWQSYEDANTESAAVATLSEPNCARSDAACLTSPAALSDCSGCERLKKGQLYTVFFLESLRQSYDVVISAPYIH